jgi:hypothetical protein
MSRQAVDFLVEQRTEIAPRRCFGKLHGRHLGQDPFSLLAPRRLGPRVPGDPEGNPIEPVCQVLAPADRAGLAEQHQERCLEGIFGTVTIWQNAPADAPDHGPVPRQQAREGNLIAAADEAFQQLGIGRRAIGLQRRQSADVAKDGVHVPGRHGVAP